MKLSAIGCAIVAILCGTSARAEASASRLSLDAGYAECIFTQSDIRNSINLLNRNPANRKKNKEVGIFTGEGYRLRGGWRAWDGIHLVASYGTQQGRKQDRGPIEVDVSGVDVTYDYDVAYYSRISHLGLGLRYERPVLDWFSAHFEGLVGPARLELRRVLRSDAFATLPRDATYTANRLAYELRAGLKLYLWRGGYIETDIGYRHAKSTEAKDASGVAAYEYDAVFQQSNDPLSIDFSGFLFTVRVGWELF